MNIKKILLTNLVVWQVLLLGCSLKTTQELNETIKYLERDIQLLSREEAVIPNIKNEIEELRKKISERLSFRLKLIKEHQDIFKDPEIMSKYGMDPILIEEDNDTAEVEER